MRCIYFSHKRFCQKNIIFNLNKDIKFIDFHNIMKENIGISLNNKKLVDIIEVEGLDVTKNKIEEMSKKTNKVFIL